MFAGELNKTELNKAKPSRTEQIGINSFFNILYCGNIPAGFIIYNCVLDEAEILNIVIDNEFKGRKFATFLLEETLKELEKKNIKTVFLETGEKNTAAAALYKKFGFEKYNTR